MFEVEYTFGKFRARINGPREIDVLINFAHVKIHDNVLANPARRTLTRNRNKNPR
jgi:hypothetical protein